jgi:hypothetical protein
MRSLNKKILSTLLFVITAITYLPAYAEVFEDNSFLIEEAYNQDPGTVQFIQSYQMTKVNSNQETGLYTFTNEMPVGGLAHQFSYAIPFMTSKTSGSSDSGIGDVVLNYRYQLLHSEQAAMAPQFSIILPTGNSDKGFGVGGVGFQTSVALSVVLSPEWVTHWNAGYTFVPSAKAASGGDNAAILGSSFGASVIYRQKETLHWLLELVDASTETNNGNGTKTRTDSNYLSPGVRYAINLKDTQIVPGLAFPVGIGASEPEEYAVFFYFSVESKLW